jgi:hypothetical protein
MVKNDSCTHAGLSTPYASALSCFSLQKGEIKERSREDCLSTCIHCKSAISQFLSFLTVFFFLEGRNGVAGLKTVPAAELHVGTVAAEPTLSLSTEADFSSVNSSWFSLMKPSQKSALVSWDPISD